MIARKNVVFPLPEAPRMAVIVASGTASSTSSSTLRSP